MTGGTARNAGGAPAGRPLLRCNFCATFHKSWQLLSEKDKGKD